jgi:predicted XRE-type DNA-binding protein
MKKSAKNGVEIDHGSGNVFADLRLKKADELLVKADLMHAINREIKTRRLTQRQASELVGLSQSDISNIARNNIDRFSQERLIGALRCLGLDVEITIQRSTNGHGALRVREHAQLH